MSWIIEKPKQAGIVGAGIMGRLLAISLENLGWQVTVFDKGSGEDNCSIAAAGLLTPYSELDKSPLLIFQLGQQAINTYWPQILSRLHKPVYFQRLGSLVVNHPKDKTEWDYFSQKIIRQLNNNSLANQLTQEDLIDLESELSHFETAYYFPHEAHIDCQGLMSCLTEYFQKKGIQFINNCAVQLLQPYLIHTKDKHYEFDMVFDCRGLGAQSAWNNIRPLRGELIWLYAPEVSLQRPVRLLHPRYSIYIVPRPGNIYLIGASEIEAEDYSSISVRTTLELLTAAYCLHPGFSEARIIKTVTHCRPTFSHHLPRIRYNEGLIAVNGLYRHGYLIAPTLAEEVVRRMQQQNLHYPEIWENAP